jgi:hypothetical protein
MDKRRLVLAVNHILSQLVEDKERIQPYGSKQGKNLDNYSNHILPEYEGDNAIFYHGTNKDILANSGKFKGMAAYLSSHPAYSMLYADNPEAWNNKNIAADKPHLYKVRIPREHVDKLEDHGPDIDDAEDYTDVLQRAVENAVQYMIRGESEDPDVDWDNFDLNTTIPHELEEIDPTQYDAIRSQAKKIHMNEERTPRLIAALKKRFG